jgi:peptidoglycan/LPS O-acetylase OafA/YrhL
VRDPGAERRATLLLGLLGLVIAAAGYAASFLPPIYADTAFWTSSPTFFFLRLGLLMAMLPLAYGWMRVWSGWSPVEEFGVASLFVYWIHVEMVYGTPTAALHGRFTLWQWPIAYVLFAAFLFFLVKLKDRLTSKRGDRVAQPKIAAIVRNGL